MVRAHVSLARRPLFVVVVIVAAHVQVQVSPLSTMLFWFVSPPLNTTGVHVLSFGAPTESAWVPVVLS
jgi:hypothetical protein